MYGLPLWKYLPVYCSPVFTSLVRHKDTLFEIIGKIVDDSLADMNAAEGEEDKDDFSILRQLLRNPGSCRIARLDASQLRLLCEKILDCLVA